MKLLLDQNISFRIAKKIAEAFPQAVHVSDCGLMDTEDMQIWEYARANEFSIATFDADYYDIALIRGIPPKIIWIRAGNISTNDLAKLLLKNKNAIIQFMVGIEENEARCLELS